MNETITVSALNRYTKIYLESDEVLKQLLVEGEILNCKKYPSGHIYFSLKDEYSSVRAIMFANYASRLNFMPKDGMKVIIPCSVSFYEKDGSFRLIAYGMIEQGTGDINKQYNETKERLEKEGYFDQDRKRALPFFPKKILVIASEAGAVIHDICNVAKRKCPFVTIDLLPVRVQGSGAVEDINKAIAIANSIEDADVVIFARGGGSKEDLWCFNDESIVRNAATLKIPYISAVGHETDFTLLDFAADRRAATPTAAADLALPDCSDLIMQYKNKSKSLNLVLEDRINDLFLTLSEKEKRITNMVNNLILSKENAFLSQKQVLEALSPEKVLQRGYSVISLQDKIISSIDEIKVDSNVTIRLKDGSFSANVVSVCDGV